MRTGFSLFDKIFTIYYNKGLECARDGNIGMAVENLTKSLSYNSHSIDALNFIGLCYYRLGKLKNAECFWIKSIDIDSSTNRARGYLDDLKKDLEVVESVYSTVMNYIDMKQYKKAFELFEKNIYSRFNQSVNVLNFFGILNLLSGKNGQAIKIWKDVIAIDVMNREALNYLAYVKEDRLSELKYRIRNLASFMSKG